MLPSLPYLKETPSQTAGPYVHIGLIPHQAGFDIFSNNFSNVLVTPETRGERIRIEGRIFDGTGTTAGDRVADRDDDIPVAYRVLGLAITAAAISFGASFWWNVLRRFVGLRRDGKTAPSA